MIIIKNVFTFLFLTWVTSAHTHGQNFTWVTLEKELPYTLSDMTATFFPAMGNSIIIVGGCSAKDGNSLDDNNDWYSCNEISDKALKFDYSTETFTSLPSLPVARYRHAAVIVDNQLFLIGGRNATDDLIPEIDVFDPKTSQWSTLMNLPVSYQLSDNAAVGYNGMIFVTGGYDKNFDASNSTFAIDVASKVITDKAQMKKARGDAHAVTYSLEGREVAYIMGGFTHMNSFCEPLKEAERYDFDKDEWVSVDSLKSKRGDKAITRLNCKILAIGGESKHAGICKNETVSKENETIPVNDVESYNPSDKDPEWKIETNLPNHHFRFAAAAVEKTDSVYVFGGQEAYSDGCKCYKNSNRIYALRDMTNTCNLSSVVHFTTSFGFFLFTLSLMATL